MACRAEACGAAAFAEADFTPSGMYRKGWPAEPKPASAGEGWWALVDDFRTLPMGQIVAGIPHIGELSLL
jgi:hypothetical protein